MSNVAISVNGLGKRYSVGAEGAPSYKTLREAIVDLVKPRRRAKKEDFWAVRDVSFEVKHGEVVGIIGRNGAGKSTLLKLLSRITAPTTGEAVLHGRLASLLEVGTGFHKELTGRENIFLNGSILGMTRLEIRRRFDEIVEFAEVARFIDTPVKHYSSGMYLRLAFSVAAHLEPEILIVDEVLAVGDASFQRKCLNKMEDVSRGGRTVLFVSHNMPAVTRLCPRTVLLDAGKVMQDGPSHEVVRTYLHSGLGAEGGREWTGAARPGNDIVRLNRIYVIQQGEPVTGAIDIRYPFDLVMDYEVTEDGHQLSPNYHFYNEEGVEVFWIGDVAKMSRKDCGRYRSSVTIPGNFLSEGSLIVSAAVSTMDPVRVHFYERDVVAIQVVDCMDGTTARGAYAGPVPGAVRPMLTWAEERIEQASAAE